MILYSIKDTKIGYKLPFGQKNDATAIREVSIAVNTPNNPINQYCEDLQLFKIGEFDEDTGKLIGGEPQFIMNLIDLKKEQ